MFNSIQILKKTGNYIFGVLLFTIVIIQFRQVFIMAHFFIHQEEITKAHCENKDKPELKCDGKCHLQKELKVEETQTPSKNEETTGSIKLLLFNAMSFDAEQDFCLCSTVEFSNNSFTYITSHSVKHTLNFFPPPNC